MTARTFHDMDSLLGSLNPKKPVLIAGPTASGKSALALEIARRQGGVIVNADSSQVYACWRVLTARPSPNEEAEAPHALYGHVSETESYSVGHWLRDVAPFLSGSSRPILVGGTGLYFTALTEGLADIPPVPEDIRRVADRLSLDALLAELDAESAARLDPANRTRVQRAWEVLNATGEGLASWQRRQGPPLLPLAQAQPVVFDAPKSWLTPRIERRFNQMLAQGALAEVKALLPRYDPALPAHRAIGAPELIAHLRGTISLAEAETRATIATRQFAKRQRTWFRRRMADWHRFVPPGAQELAET
jgi:tRNA dimethylallyltransferase